jgi:hypothetical protein
MGIVPKSRESPQCDMHARSDNSFRTVKPISSFMQQNLSQSIARANGIRVVQTFGHYGKRWNTRTGAQYFRDRF